MPKNFFCLNHLNIPWNILKKCKNHKPDPPTPSCNFFFKKNPPFYIHEIFRKNENFTKITLVKLIFGLAKRDWYQILRKSILFSYNITNNTLGEGQNWSKFKISGHFGQKNRISEWVGGVSERNFFFCPFLKNFCPFYSNHLTIPWNKWKKCKYHEPEHI